MMNAPVGHNDAVMDRSNETDSGAVSEACFESPWYLLYSKPQDEFRARDELLAQSYAVYLPVVTQERRVRGVLSAKTSALFPRYLLARPSHPEQSIAAIRSTRGVSHLVRQGPQFVTAPESMVAAIRAAEAMLANRGVQGLFQVGTTIEVIDGPFRGFVTQVVKAGTDRVSVFLEMLGRCQRLEIPHAQCRPVG